MKNEIFSITFARNKTPKVIQLINTEENTMNLLRKLMFFLLFFLFLLNLTLPVFATSVKPPAVEEVIIVSGAKNGIPENNNRIIEYNEEIELYALLKSKEHYYLGYENSSLPEEVKINNKPYSLKEGSLKRWQNKKWGELNIKWYKIMPKLAPSDPKGGYEWYSNVFAETEGEEGEWRGWQVIEYEQCSLKEKGWTLKPKKEIGTTRFRAEAIINQKVISSPGKQDTNHPSGISPQDYDKGIKNTVYRIIRLSNNPAKLIRYIEALKGVPWLWGADYKDPPQNTPSSHQSDFSNPIGIECSSLLISALRAMENENLNYTTAKNLAQGKYTRALTDASLTYFPQTFFKDWTPQNIDWSNKGKFYIYDRQKIQIRDEQFNFIKEIGNIPFQFIDIAISSEEKIYAIVEKDLESKIITIGEKEEVKELFIPEVKKTVIMEGEEYLCKMKINPNAIAVETWGQASEKKEQIYLLDYDTIYVFDLQGKELKTISLEELYAGWIPAGSLSVKEKFIYLPVRDKKILIYNLKGEIIKTIEIQESILNAGVNGEKIAILHPFPLRVSIYNLDGSFFLDFTDVFLNEQGEEVKIKIGSSPDNLQIGDVMITTSPTSHLLLFYKDNGNKILDSKDEVICAGHDGIEIRTVDYFEERKFLLKKLKPDIKIE